MDWGSIYTISENYTSSLKVLYAVNGRLNKNGIQMPSEGSLANTRKLYELLGKPLDRIPTIHVGGTNGKGSTSWKVAQCLKESGLTVGLFVSPHISSFRERVQVNSVLIDEASVLDISNQVFNACVEYSIPATLFEITFAIACIYFQKCCCDAVVIEVGLGGRLDATNVISTVCSILCSVSLDHTRILGDTVEAIARVKAGIFKKDTHALAGMGCPLDVLEEESFRIGAIFRTVDNVLDQFRVQHSSTEFTEFSEAPLPFLKYSDTAITLDEEGCLTDTDTVNRNIALAAICILQSLGGVFSRLREEDCAQHIANAACSRPPCRWEVFQIKVQPEQTSVQVILDVGHNPAAVTAIAKRIKRDFSSKVVRILYGVSKDKDIRACLRALLGAVKPDCIFFTKSNNWRAASTEELARLFVEESGQCMNDLYSSELGDCVSEVLEICASEASATGAEAVVVVCGTGYIMPEVRSRLGIVEPRDDEDLKRLV